MCLIWWSKERLLSKMIPRLRQWGEGDRVEVPIVRRKSVAVWVTEFGPITIMSDLSQLSLRKLHCIQVLISDRQFERVEWVEGVMDLVEMYSWTSSA